MEYTEQQLRFIQEKRPELKLEPEATIDYVIVEFQKKYEVFCSLLLQRLNVLEKILRQVH